MSSWLKNQLKKDTTQLPDGVPCDHPGCLRHVTHPCEGCGRVAGVAPEWKIYYGIVSAERFKPRETSGVSILLFAVTKTHSEELALESATRHYPQSEGWGNHAVDMHVIPRDWIERAWNNGRENEQNCEEV